MQRSLIYFSFRYLKNVYYAEYLLSKLHIIPVTLYSSVPLLPLALRTEASALKVPHTCPLLSLAHLVSLPFPDALVSLYFASLQVFQTLRVCAFTVFPPSHCVFQILFGCPGKPPLTVSRLPSHELPQNHLLTLAHIYLLMQLSFYSSVPHFLKAQTIPVGVNDTF